MGILRFTLAASYAACAYAARLHKAGSAADIDEIKSIPGTAAGCSAPRKAANGCNGEG